MAPSEENTVREAASESTKIVAASLPNDVFQGQYATMIADLATKEWFTARISAATLIASAYPRLTFVQQEDHLRYFDALCRDDTPMVRRVASQNLGPMLVAVVNTNGRKSLSEKGIVSAVLMPLYEILASNEQPDSIRLQTTQNCVAFGTVLGGFAPDFTASEIALIQRLLPLVVATIDDRSWRVRWTAASKFSHVIAGFDKLPGVMDSLIPAYEKLLQDPEAEVSFPVELRLCHSMNLMFSLFGQVRTAATFNLAAVAKCRALVPPPPGREGSPASVTRVTAAERLVKRVTSLTEDDSEHVRAALAMVATELAPILGKDATISYLVPPVLLLLRDAASEVRLNLISSLSALNEVIGVDLLSQSLLPAILDLAQDGKWRIRLAIIKHIPLLAKQLGMEFFSDKLSSLCVGWLGDDIASIRTAAGQNLMELASLFGTEWATEYILPSIDEIRHHESYLRRMTAVQACALMATQMDAETVMTEILPLILEMAMDNVANIRFNVAKALEKIAVVCGPEVYSAEVRPVLEILVEDQDRDVRFFAEKALKLLDETLGAARQS